MDFGALPPEINSGRMYLGAGAGTLLAASAAWDGLAAELHAVYGGYQSVVWGLTDESWIGPSSMAMTAAVAPYLVWMRATATQCEQAAEQAAAAAAAYEAAHAMTVPPAMVLANRVQLATLVAGNLLGQNTPAIMANEAEYSGMWAQDAMAMYSYAASSASASALLTFTTPPRTTNESGLAGQTAAVAQAAGVQAGSHAQASSTQLFSAVPHVLQGLTTPGSTSQLGLSPATMSGAASLGSSGASGPFGALSSLAGMSGKGLAKTAGTGAQGKSGLPSNVFSSLLGSGGSAASGVGSDAFGFGSDGFGLGSDISGFGLDLAGSGLDFAGSDSIVSVEDAPGFLGELGAVGHPWSASVDGVPAASLGQAPSLGTLSVPQSWADALSVTPADTAGPMALPTSHLGTAQPAANGTGAAKLPMGGMVGRESGGAVHRVGFRASLIPRSPMAG